MEDHTKAELKIRFSQIRRHYRARIHRFKRANEWDIGAYSWNVPGTGITLTPIESAFWHDIRNLNVVMYPQFPVSRYFVDFGNPIARVAIECDGAQWHKDVAKDEARDSRLRALGWSVYRIPGRDCWDEGESLGSGENWIEETPGRAQLFMREIVEKHPEIRRHNRSGGPWHAGEVVRSLLETAKWQRS